MYSDSKDFKCECTIEIGDFSFRFNGQMETSYGILLIYDNDSKTFICTNVEGLTSSYSRRMYDEADRIGGGGKINSLERKKR